MFYKYLFHGKLEIGVLGSYLAELFFAFLKLKFNTIRLFEAFEIVLPALLNCVGGVNYGNVAAARGGQLRIVHTIPQILIAKGKGRVTVLEIELKLLPLRCLHLKGQMLIWLGIIEHGGKRQNCEQVREISS